MCGLTGLLDLSGPGRIDEALLRRMTDAIAHRGPDGDGFHVEPGLGLGHRRLAIVDLSTGDQPMFNEDGSVVIVFNGEIYNHASLRPQLEARGHVFRTRSSDTEVIIHAWEEWGADCLKQLCGQFAIALWDRNRRQLLLARDHLGKKPMHYTTLANGTFAFASELAALTRISGLSRALDPVAIEDYFAYSYIPDPATIYRDVRKLPAASYLLISPGRPVPAPVRFWHVPVEGLTMSETEACEMIRTRLGEAVEKRLMADVPLGAFLSGGVDSSAVVATAAGFSAGPLSTFTIGFDGQEDETPLASLVAQRYGTAQHNDHTRLDYLAAAAVQARIFGEPFADSSSVPTLAVCALARRHATVAISGDGGDEVFAGYRRYRWHLLTEGVRAYLPAPIRRGVLGGLAAIYPKLDRAPRWLRAKHTLTELSLDSALGFYRMVAKSQHDRRRALYAPEFESQIDSYDPSRHTTDLMAASGTGDALRQAQFTDLNLYLPGDILTKVDRASMACSLEVRAPFLDPDMIALGMSLPASLKIYRQEGKFALKRALEPVLPREILYRPKQGFATSLAPLFRREHARVRDTLLSEPMLSSGIFSGETLSQLADEHRTGRFDHATMLWQLLVFQGFLANEAGAASQSAPAGAAYA